MVGERKVVGISQRRDRRGARFQCLAHLAWDPDVTLEVTRVPDPDTGARLAARLGSHVGVLRDGRRVVDLVTQRILAG
jgi:hypothetical protein